VPGSVIEKCNKYSIIFLPMGNFEYKPRPVLDTLVNTFSPQGSYSLAETHRFTALEAPAYMELQSRLEAPDESLRTLARELTGPFTISSPFSGQKFGALWLNRDAADTNGTRLLVGANGFLSDVTSTDDRIRAFFLAEAFPDHEVLVIDQPGHGISDKYTPQQREAALGKDGDMSGIGREQAAAIQSFIDSRVPTLNWLGLRTFSFGSRQGLDTIKANMKNPNAAPIDQSVMIELPGTVSRRFGIHFSFFLYEYLRQSHYDADWLPHFKQTFDAFTERYGYHVAQRPSFLVQDKVAALRNFYDSILGKDTGLAVLSDIVGDGAQIARVTAEHSRIDNPTHAVQQHEALGYGYTQLINACEAHDGLGHLSRARAAASVSRQIFDKWDLLRAYRKPLGLKMGKLLVELPA
jgi:pimeloyl-ACP methyl ester carboxylesterase